MELINLKLNFQVLSENGNRGLTVIFTYHSALANIDKHCWELDNFMGIYTLVFLACRFEVDDNDEVALFARCAVLLHAVLCQVLLLVKALEASTQNVFVSPEHR